ncbi:hypothetical protein BDV25DRAFT_20263 [Aspergillus avenaceus]|uniref:Uncharacterized protein n=1 Tax=Aspergillus avenaceus TaxID=36643 RepID=A0A5N6TPJ1_ASPAV|nr:hypothetical protein BDV25DRAFT_20263 [Aspergillus avenaceus]
MMDNQSALEATVISSYDLTVYLPLPASIRRRIPRLYSSLRRSARSDLDLSAETQDKSLNLSSSGPTVEPELPYYDRRSVVAPGDFHRPATAGSSSNDQESCSSSVSGKSMDAIYVPSFEDPSRVQCGHPPVTKYEEESGLRWNRVVPAINLLRNVLYEAQQPECDGRLVRSMFINGLEYLLDALPVNLTYEETSRIQQRLPNQIRTTAGIAPQPLEASIPIRRSHLHKLLVRIIVQFFLIVHFLLPYFKIILHQLQEYERANQVTERVVSATLGLADSVGKRAVKLGSTFHTVRDGNMGIAASSFILWWFDSIVGGILEGFGEGMAILEPIQLKQDSEKPKQPRASR